jgi:hypothetical protein
VSPQTPPTDAPHDDVWLEQPPGPWLVRGVRWSGWAAWGAAILALAVFLGLSVLRLTYPFELEWLEGGVLQHVARVAAGAPLYVQPSPGFTSFSYPPLYFFLAAAATRLLGPGFAALRLVSLLASLGCIALVFDIVRRSTRRAFPAAVAAGLFVATYGVSGFWFDLARVDSLAILLLLLGVRLAWFHPGRAGSVAAGLAFGLSFLAKQSALACLALLLPALFVARRRQAAWLAVTLAVLLAGTTLVLDAVSHGWYSYYVFRVRSGIVCGSIHWNSLASFWMRDLAAPFGIAMVLGLYYLVRRVPLWRREVEGARLALLGGLVFGAWVCRMEPGVFSNGSIPAYAAVAILAGLGLQEVLGPPERAATRRRALTAVCLGLAVLVQFAGLGYRPADALPRRGDRRAGELLLARLAQVKGRVFLPQHPYLLERAGLPSHAHAGCVDDVQRGDPRGWGRSLAAALDSAVAERRFAIVLLDNVWLRAEVERGYDRAGPVFTDPLRFRTVCGARVGPDFVYLPRTPGGAAAPPGTRAFLGIE